MGDSPFFGIPGEDIEAVFVCGEWWHKYDGYRFSVEEEDDGTYVDVYSRSWLTRVPKSEVKAVQATNK